MANEKEIGFKVVINGTEKVIKNVKDVNESIAALKKEIATLDFGSDAYNKATADMQKLIAANKEFTNDTVRIKEVKDQFTDLGNGISGSMSVAEDSLRAFGVENEAVSKTVRTANAIIIAINQARALSESTVEQAVARKTITETVAAVKTRALAAAEAAYSTLKDIVTGKITLSTIALGAWNVVTTVATAVTAGFTAGIKALSIAFSTNPIGAIITGIVIAIAALAAAVSAIIHVFNEGIPTIRDFFHAITFGLVGESEVAKVRENADKIVKSYNDIKDAQNKLIAEGERNIVRMRNRGESEKKIIQAEIDNMQLKVDKAKAASAQLAKYSEAGIRLSKDQVKEWNKINKDLVDNMNALQVLQDKQFAALKEQAKKNEEELANLRNSILTRSTQTYLLGFKGFAKQKKELEVEFNLFAIDQAEKVTKKLAEEGLNAGGAFKDKLIKVFKESDTKAELEKGFSELVGGLTGVIDMQTLEIVTAMAVEVDTMRDLYFAKARQVTEEAAKENAKIKLDLERWAERQRIDLIKDSYEKERALILSEFEKQKVDLKEKYKNRADYERALALAAIDTDRALSAVRQKQLDAYLDAEIEATEAAIDAQLDADTKANDAKFAANVEYFNNYLELQEWAQAQEVDNMEAGLLNYKEILAKKNAALDLQYQEDLSKLRKQFTDEAQFLEAKEKLEKDYAARRNQAAYEADQERLDNWLRVLGFMQDATNATNQTLMDLQEARHNAELKNVEQGSIEEYNIKKRQFEETKKLQVAMATISMFVSAGEAYLNGMKNPVPLLGPVTGAIYAAMALATGVANIAKIKSTNFNMSPPKAKEDKSTLAPSKFAKGGLVEGPGTSVSDSIPAMLSKGESVMTANATSNFGGLLSAINVASGGNPIGTNSNSPIFKTYVLASEITSQQEADKKIKDLARL